MTFCQVMSSGSVNCVLFVICPPCFQNSLSTFSIYIYIYISAFKTWRCIA